MDIFKYLFIFIRKKNSIKIKKKEFLVDLNKSIFSYLKKRILILNIYFKNKKRIKNIKKYNIFNLKKINIENILENHSKILNNSKNLLKNKNNFFKNY